MTPFKLYTDKSSDFECEIEIEGAELSEATARLILTTDKKSVLYEGKIDKNGKCKIDISKTKGLFEQKESGRMSLEIIVEDEAYFRPWKGEFVVDTSRKVRVEVAQPQTPTKPRLSVSVKEQVDPYEVKIRRISEFLTKNGVTTNNVLNQKRLVFEAVDRVFRGNNVDTNRVLRDIVTEIGGR